jgi:hypothetical protein
MQRDEGQRRDDATSREPRHVFLHRLPAFSFPIALGSLIAAAGCVISP